MINNTNIPLYPTIWEPRKQEFANNPDYNKILDLVESLDRGNVIARGAGYCISMSDMTQTLLKQQANIDSTITECKLTVVNDNPPIIKLIGHDGLSKGGPEDYDTHVVCVTDTHPPFLIDLSVSNIAQGLRYIVEPLNGNGKILAQYSYGNCRWIYETRETIKLPKLYQHSIIERWNSDRKLFKETRVLKVLIIVALTISTLNAIRGLYDSYQVYVNDSNSWGPQAIENINSKIENINYQLEPDQLKKRLKGAGFK